LYTLLIRFLWLTAGVAFALSFLAKLLADALLVERVAIVGSFMGLQPSLNPGVAFGVRLPGVIQTPLILLALALLAYAARKAATPSSRIGFGLLLGGALGNVVDRLPDGYVTDFFQIGSFPIFNVADSCITVGVVLLVLDGLGLFRFPR
jgi:signal peptidase II